MNPKPSLLQCLVLHDIADADVELVDGRWHSAFLGDVTRQVRILDRDGYILQQNDQLLLLIDGAKVLARRPYAELVEQFNSHQAS